MKSKILLTLGLVVLVTANVSAQSTFGTVGTITGDTDVIDFGTNQDIAVFFNDSAPGQETVNGVAFTNGSPVPGIVGNPYDFTAGAYTLDINAAGLNEYGGFGSPAGTPSATFSTSYQGLLGGAINTGNVTTTTLTLSGLTAGTEYEYQLFVQDPRGGLNNRDETLSDGATSGTLAYQNLTDTGSFVTATFTATGADETILVNSTGASQQEQINAFELGTVVPEPTTVALLAFSVLGLVPFLRRRLTASI